MSDELIKETLKLKKWVVVGATPNKEKTANHIVKKLISGGYEVYCVNPNYDEIEGMKCYKDIDSIPEKPDGIDFVVPPSVTLKAIESLNPDEIKCLWMQPGSFDDAVVKRAKERGFKVIADGACILVEMGLNC